MTKQKSKLLICSLGGTRTTCWSIICLPHGLEQYGGAAWGPEMSRKDQQKLFLAVNRPEIVASIIKHLFANQFADDGNWPQWFMFDRYEKQKADESHGDVIVWPMKVVSDYLEKRRTSRF